MFNYKLIIQYDGTDYAGWQIQENAKSVQGTISGAIKIILRKEVNLVGAGRTDTGVHALGQAANFQYPDKIDPFHFQYSLNSILPKDISVIKTEKVSESFHSRFDAKERSYLYLISKDKSPFYYKYSLLKKNVDVKILNQLSDIFLGRKNFASFCRKNSQVKNKVCDINFIRWRETKNFYLFFISADRFLHGMVRTIIGTMLYTSEKKRNKEFIRTIIEKKDREAAGEAVAAKGLFLYKVKY